jgi:ankyrin repeat protein
LCGSENSDFRWETPLVIAVREFTQSEYKERFYSIIIQPLNYGADPNSSTKRIPLLHFSLFNNLDSRLVEMLVEKGADLKQGFGETNVMELAATCTDLSVIKLFLQGRENPKTGIRSVLDTGPTTDESMILYYAVKQGNLMLIEFLLESGAQVQVPNSAGEPLLVAAVKLAANSTGLSVVELLRSGGNPNTEIGLRHKDINTEPSSKDLRNRR